MLKYSPEHMHCLANIFGALAPPNTGVLAVQSTAANQKVESRSPSIYSEGSSEEWRFLYNLGRQQDCRIAAPADHLRPQDCVCQNLYFER